MSGGANIYRPKYFLDEDVVLVTFNYRLASFGMHYTFHFLSSHVVFMRYPSFLHDVCISGFLNTGDGMVHGNMGLKDQVILI